MAIPVPNDFSSRVAQEKVWMSTWTRPAEYKYDAECDERKRATRHYRKIFDNDKFPVKIPDTIGYQHASATVEYLKNQGIHQGIDYRLVPSSVIMDYTTGKIGVVGFELRFKEDSKTANVLLKLFV